MSATNNVVFVDQRIWTPPKNWYKVNTDGAVFRDKRWSGVGVIIKDEWGRVVAAMSKRLQVPWKPWQLKQQLWRMLSPLREILAYRK